MNFVKLKKFFADIIHSVKWPKIALIEFNLFPNRDAEKGQLTKTDQTFTK